MLSGIGPKEVLSPLGIPVKVDSPEVGQSLHDHLQFSIFWKLKDPSAGYAVRSGNPLFTQPQFARGMPIDFVVTTTVSKEGLAQAIALDEGELPSPNHPLLKNDRSFMEHLVVYASANPADPFVSANGTHITGTVADLMPTSKGHVRINSTNPADPPVLDPNYLSTRVDRYAFREGLRTAAHLMLGTEAGRSFIEGETPPNDFDPISVDSDDEYLDARVRHGALYVFLEMAGGPC